MTAIKIKQFKGIAPKIHERRLPPVNSQVARNCRLESGVFSPTREKLFIETLGKTSEIKSIYLSYAGYWLHWNGEVDVARSPIANSNERLYFTGDGYPKVLDADMIDTGLDNQYPNSSYLLGVPYPSTAPGVAAGAGGSGTARSLSYVYTLVTGWNEEGPPSTPSAIVNAMPAQTVDLTALGIAITSITRSGSTATVTTTAAHGLSTNDKVLVGGAVQDDYNLIASITVTGASEFTFPVSGTPASPATGTIACFLVDADSATGPVNVTKKYLYRTNTGSYSATYQFVAEIDVGTVTYADALLDDELGEEIPSTEWYPPPTDLAGIMASPNGFLVGFSPTYGLCFSDPLSPHAWPTAYRQMPDYPIVAIALHGSSVIVGTERNPYIYTGIHPSAMNPTRVEREWPCTSKRAMKSVGTFGVFYPTREGLVQISGNGASLYTQPIMSKDNWLEYEPDDMHAVVYDRYYILFYRTGTNGDANIGGALVFSGDANNAEPTELSFFATAAHYDPRAGYLYYVIPDSGDNDLYLHEANNGTLLGEWKSEKFNIGRPIAMQAGRVSADYDSLLVDVATCEARNADILADNQALIDSGDTGGGLGDSALADIALADDLLDDQEECGSAHEMTFKLYVDGTLVHERVVDDSEPFRIPPKRGRDFEIYISGSATVYELAIAETKSELSRN